MEGRLESVWRYPVKGMRGERVKEVFVGEHGVAGDRVYAFSSPSLPESFPWYTARKRADFVLHRPYFLGPYFLGEKEEVEVEMSDGRVVRIDDPLFHEELMRDFGKDLVLNCGGKNMVDSQPVSLISLQSLRLLEEEMGRDLDKRRFRANLYVDWGEGAEGFYEDSLVGRRLRVGDEVEMYVEERNSRCKIVSVDPDTAEVDSFILKEVVKKRSGYAGVYLTLVKEGVVREGARVEVVP